jgi:hypothetical protein
VYVRTDDRQETYHDVTKVLSHVALFWVPPAKGPIVVSVRLEVGCLSQADGMKAEISISKVLERLVRLRIFLPQYQEHHSAFGISGG